MSRPLSMCQRTVRAVIPRALAACRLFYHLGDRVLLLSARLLPVRWQPRAGAAIYTRNHTAAKTTTATMRSNPRTGTTFLKSLGFTATLPLYREYLTRVYLLIIPTQPLAACQTVTPLASGLAMMHVSLFWVLSGNFTTPVSAGARFYSLLPTAVGERIHTRMYCVGVMQDPGRRPL